MSRKFAKIIECSKYIKLFSIYEIDFKLIDYDSNIIYSPKDFKLKGNIKDLLNSIITIDIDNLSVSEAYNFIENLKEKVKIIINKYL